MSIPVVIPAYEPSRDFIQFCTDLQRGRDGKLVVVDDGSGETYKEIFEQIKALPGSTVLTHPSNLGKGKALKTAFFYLLNEEKDLLGCVTADSDGQHSKIDILKCINNLTEHPEELVLGCRDFDGDHIPAKSKMGNKITRKVCKYLCGLNLSDTQTGLRGIPKAFMEELLGVKGDRFEFETQMLVESIGKYPIFEYPIQTIYESKTDHKTHFRPVKDSLIIYGVLGRILLRYLLSSLSSCVVDVLVFGILCHIFREAIPIYYVAISTVGARIISSCYNYLINYKFVFKSSKTHQKSSIRYFSLVIVQMALSSLFTTLFVIGLNIQEVISKIIVDSVLFFFSYYIQRKFVF